MKKTSMILLSAIMIAVLIHSVVTAEEARVLDLPISLKKIEAQAFSGDISLTNVIVPEQVYQIGAYAFSECANLECIALPEKLTAIGDGLFFGCRKLNRINIPAKITCIGEKAFMDCELLSELTIPEGVVDVGAYAFSGCSGLAKIYLPKSLKTIGAQAFTTGSGETVVMVVEGSEAHKWCVENKIAFDYHGERLPTPSPTPSQTPSPEPTATEPVNTPVEYRALIIGNTYPDTENALPGPDTDIASMSNMLALQTGTPYTVSNRLNVTATGMRTAIAAAFAGADGNDVSLFYYSGHGTTGYLTGALVGADGSIVSVDELRAWLDQVPGKKIVLLDSCYSGNNINRSAAGEEFSPDDFNDSVIAAFAPRTRANLESSDYYVITSCSKDQQSLSLTWNNVAFGIFTYGLTRGSGYNLINPNEKTWHADVNNDGSITIIEAYNDAVAAIEDWDCDQSPRYYGPQDAVLWGK